MKNRTVELYWDPGSTNTYFAFKLIQPVLDRTGARLVLRPFNLGHVFRVNNYVLMEEPESKINNRKRDLQRWARKYELPFQFPDKFPIKTSRALRGAIAMRDWGLEHAFTEEVLDAYWERSDSSIEIYDGLRPLAKKLGVDPDDFERVSESQQVRDALAKSTDEGMRRGVFGAPTFIVGDELFWGKDRIDFVEDELVASGSSESTA